MTEIRPGDGQKGQVQMDSEWTFTDLFYFVVITIVDRV